LIEVSLEGKTTQGHIYIIRHALGDQELADLYGKHCSSPIQFNVSAKVFL
jgi:hypothetical protein